MNPDVIKGELWHKWYHKWGMTSGVKLEGNGIKVMLDKLPGPTIQSGQIAVGTIFQGSIGARYGLWARIEARYENKETFCVLLNPECAKKLFHLGPNYPGDYIEIKDYVPVQLIAAAIPISEIEG